MTATRALYLVVVAVLVVATLTMAAALLARAGDRPAGADLAICQPDEPPQGCYPADA